MWKDQSPDIRKHGRPNSDICLEKLHNSELLSVEGSIGRELRKVSVYGLKSTFVKY